MIFKCFRNQKILSEIDYSDIEYVYLNFDGLDKDGSYFFTDKMLNKRTTLKLKILFNLNYVATYDKNADKWRKGFDI